MEPVRIAVLGCGKVSHQYLPNLLAASALELAVVGDIDPANAQAVADQYGVVRTTGPEAILADPDIELVVNLTPISSHVAVSQAALSAGKHVYSEKPLADSLVGAQDLLVQAGECERLLACAPDTLLGSGFQASRDLVRSGAIGRPIAATATMYRRAFSRPEYGADSSPFFDMAPYYLSALVNLFGPARRVSALARIREANESEHDQQRPVILSGTIEFDDDVLASLTVAWGTNHRPEVPTLIVSGSDGELAVPNPNTFGDVARVRSYADPDWREVLGSRQPADLPANLRGLGVADLAVALRENVRPRAAADIAAHVVDIITALVSSARTGRHAELTTTCAPAESLSPAGRADLLH